MGETSKCRARVLKYCQGNGLDIGCGDDKISPTAIGVDKCIHPNVNLNIDIRRIGDFIKPESLDYVFSSHTLEDFDNTHDLLLQWFSLIKLGGYLVLYLPHKNWYPNIGHALANKGHRHDFLPNDITEIIYSWYYCRIEYCTEYGPPNGIYDYENRGKIEYSFEIVARKI